VQFAGVTDVGRVRETNEDAFCVWPLPCPGGPVLLAVADGLGGHQAGEVASHLAIHSLQQALAELCAAGPSGWTELLRSAMAAAHERIRASAAGDAQRSGMGTTLTAAVVEGGRLWWGHVGDSRAYLWRQGLLTRLTEDHSVAGELVRGGHLDERAAAVHPQRHVLTRALGMEAPLPVDTGEAELQPGDWILLATDGLTAVVPAEEIRRACAEASSPDALARSLVDLANHRGGPDNVTVVVARA
jgi:serine/threonine protein phosphatase PrpC